MVFTLTSYASASKRQNSHFLFIHFYIFIYGYVTFLTRSLPDVIPPFEPVSECARLHGNARLPGATPEGARVRESLAHERDVRVNGVSRDVGDVGGAKTSLGLHR